MSLKAKFDLDQFTSRNFYHYSNISKKISFFNIHFQNVFYKKGWAGEKVYLHGNKNIL